jgi:hypothetical protein
MNLMPNKRIKPARSAPVGAERQSATGRYATPFARGVGVNVLKLEAASAMPETRAPDSWRYASAQESR